MGIILQTFWHLYYSKDIIKDKFFCMNQKNTSFDQYLTLKNDCNSDDNLIKNEVSIQYLNF